MPRAVYTGVGRLTDMRAQQDVRIRKYKVTEFRRPAAHDLMVRAVDSDVLPPTPLPAVLREWRALRRAAFAAKQKSA